MEVLGTFIESFENLLDLLFIFVALQDSDPEMPFCHLLELCYLRNESPAIV